MGKKGVFRQWFDLLSGEEKTAYYVDQQTAREQGSIMDELEKAKRRAASVGRRSETAGCAKSLVMLRRPRQRRAATRSTSSGAEIVLPMVLILPSFPVPRDPTAKVGLRLRRCSEKTPAAPAQARKRCAHRHSARRILPDLDCRRPPPDESRRSPVQVVLERYRRRKRGPGNGHRQARTHN